MTARVSARDMVLVGSLIASSALTVVLGVVDPIGIPVLTSRFLVWNLFLAWVPLVAAIAVSRASRPVAVVAGVVWLVFLPNALYLVTDLVHLVDGSTLWRHILQFGFAAWTGTLLAVVSLRIVHRRAERETGRAAGWLVVAAAVVAAGIGVAIGRFQRWNSWDLLTEPDSIAHGTLSWVRSPFADARITGVALAVTAFFGIAYLTVWALTPDAGPLSQTRARRS
ncbi:MAG TPA: DUF1361 domain-containing protein [Acidimicrobiales bacterium]|nr:DUF1361 domain-containing protein [Acidimicrobiales bacterium]